MRCSGGFWCFLLTMAAAELLFGYPKPPFRDPALSRKLYPGMKTVREWAKENAAKLFPN
jgi:hypothetical protein